MNHDVYRVGFALVIVACSPSVVQAQSPAPVAESRGAAMVKKTSVYLEVLGNGGLYSINVERFLSNRVAARIGFGSWATGDVFGAGNRSIVTFPVVANALIGQGNSRLEAGAGLLLGRSAFSSAWDSESDRSDPILDLTGVIGYRYLQPDGFLFRIGLTPFLDLTGGDDPYPDSGLSFSAGLSFGYRF